MDRRRFLSASAAAGLSVGLPAETLAQTLDQAEKPAGPGAASALQASPPPSGLPPELMGAAATEAYFSDEKLHAALGSSKLTMPSGVEVVAFNFPSWHPSPFMEERFGKGWTEFDTLRNARRLFPGHTMPHYPLWGYYDEADPVWAAREIDLAAAHGVDAWMIDWYWHSGTQFYQEQIEQGLLRAPNRDKIRFAIMWANHDWKNVYPARSPGEAALLLPQMHSVADFEAVATYCAEHYFHQPNYLRIDGAPVFSIFDLGKLLEQLGADGVKRALVGFRERARTLGVAELHLQIVSGYDRHAAELRGYGFDSATQYGTFGWTYGSKPPGSRIPYGVGCTEAVASWLQARSLPLPFFPCVQVGWDDSPRFEEFASVAINRSPDQFERLLRGACHTLATAKTTPRLVYVAAWNEWTEDHVLLPDTIWGYSYLEAVRRVKGAV